MWWTLHGCREGGGGGPCGRRLPLQVWQDCYLEPGWPLRLPQERIARRELSAPVHGPTQVWEPRAPESPAASRLLACLLDSQETGHARTFWHSGRSVNTWQGSRPPPTVRTSRVEFQRLMTFFRCRPAPSTPAIHPHSGDLCYLLPIAPGSFFFPPRFIHHRPASGLSSDGPETLLARPSQTHCLGSISGSPPWPVSWRAGHHQTAQEKTLAWLGSCVWFGLVGGTLPGIKCQTSFVPLPQLSERHPQLPDSQSLPLRSAVFSGVDPTSWGHMVMSVGCVRLSRLGFGVLLASLGGLGCCSAPHSARDGPLEAAGVIRGRSDGSAQFCVTLGAAS